AGDSDLFVFSDGPRSPADTPKIESVREYVRGIRGFKSVTLHCQSQNRGLAESIISGVTEMCRVHQRVIVMEDDLLTAPYFLRVMNDAIDLYETEPKVISIHGYLYPVRRRVPDSFFLRGADSWGWATWQRGWELFRTDGAQLLAELRSRELTREFDFNG